MEKSVTIPEIQLITKEKKFIKIIKSSFELDVNRYFLQFLDIDNHTAYKQTNRLDDLYKRTRGHVQCITNYSEKLNLLIDLFLNFTLIVFKIFNILKIVKKFFKFFVINCYFNIFYPKFK